MNLERHNIKATMTAHGLNDWSEAQKVFYLIKRIKINIFETYIANSSGSADLHDEFSAAARYVADFLVIIKSHDPGSNRNILGVDTDQGGDGGWRSGEGPGHRIQGGGGGHSRGRGGNGVLPQDAVNA